MNKLYNIGDSFSYGNCLCRFEEFATDGEGNIEQAQERTVRVAEAEHQPTRFVSNIQIPTDLKAMQRFQQEAHRDEDHQHDPSKGEVRPNQ